MKLTLPNVGDLTQTTTAQTTINRNNDKIETAFENTLSRDGTTPNQMQAELDMNSNHILNLPAPTGPASPLRLQELSDFVGGGTVTNIPAGGNLGQSLTKHSNADFDVQWSTVGGVSSVGLSLPPDFTVTNSPVVSSGTLTGAWATPPTGTGAVVRATSPTVATPTLSAPNIQGGAVFQGSTSGTTVVNVPAVASGNITIPAGTDTLVARNTTDTLTNKTLTSPTMTAPVLGTPASGTLTNCTGYPTANLSGLGAGIATFLATPNSANLKSAVTDETGSGGALVFATSPSLTTPSMTTPSITGATTITNNSSAALAVGANGTTNPAFKVDASAGSVATGLNVIGQAAAGGVALTALSSGTNEGIALNGKGSGLVSVGNVSTGGVALAGGGGGVTITGTTTHTSNSANAITAGPNGATNPTLKIDSSVASAATGLQIQGQAATGGVAVSAISSGTDEGLAINAKGAGVINVGNSSTGGVILGGNVTVAGTVLNTAWTSYSPSLSAGSGTFTSATASGWFKQIGKTVFVRISVNITTAGSAAGAIIVGLPTNTATTSGTSIPGSNLVSLKAGAAQSAANTNTTSFLSYDGTTAIASGAVVVIEGVYESA